MLPFFVLPFILSSSFSHAGLQEIYIADLAGAVSPAGFACKNPSSANASDFVFSGFVRPGNTSNIIKAAVTSAFISPGGVVPLHTHPGASKLLIMTQGIIEAGFISSANVVYSAMLKKGEVMVFPRGLVHWQVNVARHGGGHPEHQQPPARVAVTDVALFANDLPTSTLAKISFLW